MYVVTLPEDRDLADIDHHWTHHLTQQYRRISVCGVSSRKVNGPTQKVDIECTDSLPQMPPIEESKTAITDQH